MILLTVTPIFYFFPQPYAAYAGIITIVYQLMIFLSGNYAWVNLITAVLAGSTFSDALFAKIFSLDIVVSSMSPYPYEYSLMTFSLIVLFLSIFPIKDFFTEFKYQNKSYGPFYLVNTYGTFSSVAKERKEIVIQGRKTDDEPWTDFLVKGQPKPDERPRQISPYNQRLYYSFWMLCQRDSVEQEWFARFVNKLRQDFEAIKPFLAENSATEEVEEVRVVEYTYEFTSSDERRETGRFWKRKRSKVHDFK